LTVTFTVEAAYAFDIFQNYRGPLLNCNSDDPFRHIMKECLVLTTLLPPYFDATTFLSRTSFLLKELTILAVTLAILTVSERS